VIQNACPLGLFCCVVFVTRYDISSKTELEAFMTKLWRQPLGVDVVHGVSYDDVADSYKGCEEDIADLVSKGRFYVVVNPKTQKKQLFYPDSAPLPAKPLDNALLQVRRLLHMLCYSLPSVAERFCRCLGWKPVQISDFPFSLPLECMHFCTLAALERGQVRGRQT